MIRRAMLAATVGLICAAGLTSCTSQEEFNLEQAKQGNKNAIRTIASEPAKYAGKGSAADIERILAADRRTSSALVPAEGMIADVQYVSIQYGGIVDRSLAVAEHLARIIILKKDGGYLKLLDPTDAIAVKGLHASIKYHKQDGVTHGEFIRDYGWQVYAPSNGRRLLSATNPDKRIGVDGIVESLEERAR
jgi:hypothetical protein